MLAATVIIIIMIGDVFNAKVTDVAFRLSSVISSLAYGKKEDTCIVVLESTIQICDSSNCLEKARNIYFLRVASIVWGLF